MVQERESCPPAALVLVFCLASAGQAATIIAGDHELAPGGRTAIPITIQREDGDPDILGVELVLQIADGSLGPTIGMVDLVTGTIFDSNHTGSRDKGSLPRQAFWETTTASGAVSIPESGLLATVEIDTTGLSQGTFDLRLTSVMGTSTVLFDDMANLVIPNSGAEIRGSVTVVAEPAGWWLAAELWLVLLLTGRRLVGSRSIS